MGEDREKKHPTLWGEALSFLLHSMGIPLAGALAVVGVEAEEESYPGRVLKRIGRQQRSRGWNRSDMRT